MLTWLYLPNGCKVQFDFTEASMPEFDYDNALSYTNRLIARGASVDAPGLEAGEHKDEIGSLTHWLKNDDDGGQSHRVDLYVNHPQMVNRFLSLYVKDTKEALAEFKAVTGVDLASIPMLPTKAPINKDDDKGGIITALPRPLMAIWKLNPKFDETQPLGGGHSRRLFVRWEGVGVPTVSPTPQAPQNAATTPPATVTPETPQIAGNGALNASTDNPVIAEHWNELIKGVKNHSFNGVKPSGQEIANTINKMKSEGAFENVVAYPMALELIIHRIQKHYAKPA